MQLLIGVVMYAILRNANKANLAKFVFLIAYLKRDIRLKVMWHEVHNNDWRNFMFHVYVEVKRNESEIVFYHS